MFRVWIACLLVVTTAGLVAARPAVHSVAHHAHARAVHEPVTAAPVKAPHGTAAHTLVIGTRVIPPFAFKDNSGEWQGLSIDLWRDIVARLKLDYRFEDAGTVKELITGVTDRKFDAGVAALTVTEERERLVDFTHPFFSTGLAIATAPAAGSPVWSAAFALLTWETLGVVGLVMVSVLSVGVLLWRVERKVNSDINSTGEGFWASLTMLLTSQFTTPEPRSGMGRLFATLWVMVSIVIMTFFTGVVTSALTVQSLQGRVRGVSDLPSMRVGAVTGSTGAQWLTDERIQANPFSNVTDGLKAVVDGRIDALVFDAPVLRYLARTDFEGKVLVLPDNFAPQDYAIALPENSALRRPVNHELIAIKRSEVWTKRVFEYLGER